MEQYIPKSALVAEIVRRRNIVKNSALQMKDVEKRNYYLEMVEEYDDILRYVDSLPKEPVSEDEIEKQFKAGDVVVYVSRQPAYSGLYLLGNPNDLSIGYSNANEPYQIALRNCTVASEDERKQFMRELDSNGYKWNEDTLRIEKEEPVSEDLKEAAITAADKDMQGRQIMEESNENRQLYSRIFRRGFKVGAQWMAKQGITREAEIEVHDQ